MNVATITAKWMPKARDAFRAFDEQGQAAWDAFWDSFYDEGERRRLFERYDKAADRIMRTLEAEA